MTSVLSGHPNSWFKKLYWPDRLLASVLLGFAYVSVCFQYCQAWLRVNEFKYEPSSGCVGFERRVYLVHGVGT